MVRIDLQGEAIGVCGIVAAREAARNLPRFPIVQPDADVERRGVVDDAELRAFRGGLPLVGIALEEFRRRRRVAPRGVVEAAIEARGLRDAHGTHGGHGSMTLGERRPCGGDTYGGGDAEANPRREARHGSTGQGRRGAPPGTRKWTPRQRTLRVC